MFQHPSFIYLLMSYFLDFIYEHAKNFDTIAMIFRLQKSSFYKKMNFLSLYEISHNNVFVFEINIFK